MGLTDSDKPPRGLPSFLEPIRCLGEGGMGAVWSVRDRRTGEIGALKAIRSSLLTDRAIVRRFERELRTLARLNHAGIVQVLDVGRLSTGAPYLLMEQVEGVPLIDLELSGRSLGELIRLFDRILAALGYAHARRIIHRDLKPDNVLVTTDELGELHPKLMDFGLAMVAVRGQLSATRLTADGMVVGTPAYMAPEQACDEHHKIGAASDLYAFGCMLYELLTGAPPHIASSPMALLLAHATKPPRPFTPLPTLPSASKLEPLVMRLLAKDPLDRFECAADVRMELRRSGLLEASDIVESEPLGPWGDTILDMGAVPSSNTGADPILPTTTEPNTIGSSLWSFDSGGPVASTPAKPKSPGLEQLAAQPRIAEKPAEAMLQVSVLNLREPPFVGRTGPRNTLHRYIEDVREAGQTAVCLVSGPTGIGKSRLVNWIACEGEARGAVRYLRVSLSSGSSVSICMLQAISDHLRLRGLSRAHALQALKRFFRTSDADDWRVAGLLDVVTARGGRMVSSTMSRLELLIYAAIEQLAVGRPLMLWLDETHTIPPSQIAAFIRGLCIRQEKRPSPVLVTVVDRAETDMPSDLELAIGKIEEAWLRPGIHLTPLSSPEMYELTRSGLNLSDELARHVVNLSEGLALLAVALARQWHAAGLLRRTARGFENTGQVTELPVPEAVQSVFTNQLELAFHGMSEEVWRPVAELAAVLGDSFRGSWLSDGLPALPGHASAVRAENFLERTQSAGLIRILPGETSNLYSFSNSLMREGLLASIPTERLADLHRAAAQAKQSTLASTPSSLIEIAQHLLAGRAYDQAYEMFVSAARGLVAHARFDDAVGVLEAAHQSLANSSGVSGPWDSRVATVWELEHEIAIARYDLDTARERADWLMHAASRLGDPAWDARVKRALGMVQQRSGDVEKALVLLKESENILRATEQSVATQRELGKTLLARADVELALDHTIEIGPIAFEAVALARIQDDTRLLARALAFSGCSALLHELGSDELEKAREQLEEALEHSRDAGDLRTEAAVVDGLADIEIRSGNLKEAEALLHQASRCYEALGDFEVTAEVHRRLAELARSQGRKHDAIAHERWLKLLGA